MKKYLVVLAIGNDERRYYVEVKECDSLSIERDRAFAEALIDWREEFGHNGPIPTIVDISVR